MSHFSRLVSPPSAHTHTISHRHSNYSFSLISRKKHDYSGNSHLLLNSRRYFGHYGGNRICETARWIFSRNESCTQQTRRRLLSTLSTSRDAPSAAVSTPIDDLQRFTPKQDRARKVKQIAAYLERIQELYPSPESVHRAQQECNIASIEETRRLLELARQTLKGARTKIARSDRNQIREHILHSQRPFNVQRIYNDLLEQFPHLSWYQLYHAVWRSCISIELKTTVTPEMQQEIAHHIAGSSLMDVSLLCDDLQSKFDWKMTRGTLSTLVRDALRRQHKSGGIISRAERKRLREYVASSPRPLNVQQIYTELRDEFSQLTNRHFYRLVLESCASLERKENVSPEVRDTIQLHVTASSHPDNVPLLCDELESKLGLNITRSTLYRIVRDIARQTTKSENVTTEDRKRILEVVLGSPRPLHAPRICDSLHEQLPHLSRNQLHRLVVDCCVSIERKELMTPEVVHLIEKHVSESEHSTNVILLCDEIQEKLGFEFPRRSLYKVVRDAVKKKS